MMQPLIRITSWIARRQRAARTKREFIRLSGHLKGPKGHVVYPIDDRVDIPYICDLLNDLGFSVEWFTEFEIERGKLDAPRSKLIIDWEFHAV